MCITFLPCKEPTLPGVYWRDDAAWRPYDAATSRAILNAAAKGLKKLTLGSFTSGVYPGGATYELCLDSLEQRNVQSGQTRPVRFIPDINIMELRLQASARNAARVWMRVAEAFTREDFLYEAVNTKAAEECKTLSSVTRNPYLHPGTPHFKSFVQTLATLPVTEAVPILSKGFNKMSSCEASKLELVFHGPRQQANINPILRSGMCPTKRSSPPLGSWFGRNLSTAMQYAADNTVLAFLVVLDARVLARNAGGVIVMTNNSYELPVAEVVAY